MVKYNHNILIGLINNSDKISKERSEWELVQSLPVKYRPKTFEEVVGQNIIKKTKLNHILWFSFYI